MEPIGYQDGIKAFNEWFTKFGLWQRSFERWAMLPDETRAKTKPPIPPAIPGRGPNYDAGNVTTWPWPEKHARTERKLKDWHDSSIETPPVGGGEPGTPVKQQYSPLAYNSGSSPQNSGPGKEPSARYNVQINATRNPNGTYTDQMGINYDDGGRQISGRTENYVPGLKHADSMDGKEPWEVYTDSPDRQPHPPYPAASYDR